MIRDLELYIHIPFCVKKCSYCDFLSAPASESVQQAYVQQLLKEIAEASKVYPDSKIQTIFIGGGTPSILPASGMKEIFRQLRSCFDVCPDAEITAECNPGTLDEEKLAAYRASGIRRLSIGLQSADAGELELLGRIHTFEQFVSNYRLARQMGFYNINVDLMSALPGQKIRTYKETVEKVLELQPEHISAYSLMIEEGTPFYARFGQAQRQREKGNAQNLLPSEEEERQMYAYTKERLQSAGYGRYEISNYARNGYACRHNIGYWMRDNYLGLGLGAASLVQNVRFYNPSDLKTYLALDFAAQLAGRAFRDSRAGHAQAEKYSTGWQAGWEVLPLQAQMEEFMFLGLRMMSGVSSERFYGQFSKRLEAVFGTVLEKHIKQGLIKKTQNGYRLTDYGIDVSNYVMADYLL